jgi:glycosyltransferase involved in cell wall biosynthesis
MRVVILIEDFSPTTGGGERQMEELGKALMKRGLDVCVITRRHSGMSSYDVIDGLPVHRFPFPLPPRDRSNPWIVPRWIAIWSNSLMFYLCSAKFLRAGDIRFQVILVQAGISAAERIPQLPVFASLVGTLLRRTKVVMKPWLKPWPGRIADSDGSVLRTKKERDSILGSTLFGLVRDHSDSFVAITETVFLDLLKEGVPEHKIARIPNGVDTNRLKPLGIAEKDDAKAAIGLSDRHVVTFVGTLKPVKGLDVLLKAWRQVARCRTNVHLLIVGRKEDEFHSLSKFVDENGMGDSVTFTGEVNSQQVHKYLGTSDLFVLPSFSEGFSNALLEALSCELPVVVSDVPGLTEAVAHGASGLVFPAGNCDALAACILSLLDDRSTAEQLGRAGRQRVVEKCSIDAVAARYDELFQSLFK